MDTLKAQISITGIWMLSLPLILSTAIETILHLTDVVFLARASTVELGAVAIGFAILDIAVVLLLALADAILVVLARRAGEEKPEEIGSAFNQGLSFMMITSLLIMLTLKLTAPLLVECMVQSSEVQNAAESFLSISAFMLPVHAANLVFYALFTSVSRTRVLVWSTVLLTLSNLALDYCLILGNCGCPRLGIQGAALSDLISESVACLFLLVNVLTRTGYKQFRLICFTRWQYSLASLFGNLAVPTALKGLIECVAWMVFFAIFERRGQEALASASVIYGFYIFLLIPSKGLSEVICSMVSNLIGQGEEGKIGMLLRRAVALNFANTGPFLILALSFPALAISLVGTEGAAMSDCVSSLRVLVLVLCTAIPGQIYSYAVYGTGDSLSSLGIEVVTSTCLVGAAYAIAVLLSLPLAYTWMALGISWIVCLALSATWLRYGHRRRVKI